MVKDARPSIGARRPGIKSAGAQGPYCKVKVTRTVRMTSWDDWL